LGFVFGNRKVGDTKIALRFLLGHSGIPALFACNRIVDGGPKIASDF
jgi:hypothetical protein